MHFIVFDFSWDDRYTQEKLETMVMQIFLVSFWGGGGGGLNKVHYGLCENGELPLMTLQAKGSTIW